MRHINREQESFVPSAPLQAQNAPPAFRLEAVRSVRMHKKLAASVAAVAFALVVLFALTRRPVYEAESLTYVEPLATKVMSDGSPGFYDPSRYDSYIDQQIQTAQRPDILAAAAAKLPEGVWRRDGESVSAAAARLASVVQVKRVGTSYQLSISATGPDPVGAAAAVNAVTDAFLEQGSKDEHAIADGRILLLSEERQRIQNELLEANAEQNTLSTSLGVANPTGDAGNPYDSQLENLRTELAVAREAHDVAAAQLQSMNPHGGDSAGLVAAANDSIAGDSGLSTMKASINQRRALLQSQMAGLTPSNPVYKLDAQEISAMDSNLDTMTGQLRKKAEQNLQAKLRQELDRTGGVEAKLNAQLAFDTARATGAAPKLQRATELAADITRLQAAFAEVDSSLRALQLETQGPGMAHLSVAATPPSAPAASRRNQLLLLAIPLAFLAGIAAAVIARKRDPHAYTASDLEHVLGFPPMAVMPVATEVSEAVMEEYLLRLASGVERAHRSDGARSFVFTAVSASMHIEGLIAVLARKLMELGFEVNTVDVDSLRRVPTPEAIESRRGAGVATIRLQKLQEEADVVLIEARPLLFSAETEYAATAADATILVAESGLTLCKEMKDAASLLDRLHVKGVAVVLSNLHLAFADPQFSAAVEELERSADRTHHRQAAVREAVESATESVPVAVEDVAVPTAFMPDPEAHFESPVIVEQEAIVAPAITAVEEAPAAVAHVPLLAAPVLEIPVVHIPVDTPAAKEALESTIEEPVAAPEPIRAPAPRHSFMSTAEQDVQPKPSFFDRIFKRFHEPVVSILPARDEEDAAAVFQPVKEALVSVPPAQTLAPVAELPFVECREELEPVKEETSAIVPTAETSPEVPPVVAVHNEPEQGTLKSYREELDAALARAAAKHQSRETLLTDEVHPLVEERSNAAEGQDVAWDLAAERHALATAETETAAPRLVAPPASVVEPEVEFIEPKAEFVPKRTELVESRADFKPEPELEPETATEVHIPMAVQATPTVASQEHVSTPLPQPMMRQWEFRQARSMRESAANAARIAQESAPIRRTSRPGVVSATGRRTLVEEPAVAALGQPRSQAPWLQQAESNTVLPSRKWGMLSRFDQRFKADDASGSNAEPPGEEELAVNGAGRRLGSYRD